MNILLFILIGGVAGWLASNFMKGQSLGLVWNVVLGIGGAFVGKLLFGVMGMNANGNLLGVLLTATVGAIIVLFVANKLKK
jgi:uncharacterized membrane protein YeaQ/YmgE (transglycosylase-associated protein family)